MHWKQYWRNIVQRYLVKIEGWPDTMSIEKFSVASCPIDDLRGLLRKWLSGDIYWKVLSPAELEDLQQERELLINEGKVQGLVPRRRRSDVGKKRKRRNLEDNAGPAKKKRHSRNTASFDTDEDEGYEEKDEDEDGDGWEGCGLDEDEDDQE